MKELLAPPGRSLCMSKSISDHISQHAGEPDLTGILSERLAPSELSSLLLEVFHRQTQRLTPPALLTAYRNHRFVQPAAVDPVTYREFELRWLKSARDHGFEPLELSPLAPLGSCSAVGTVHQNKIISATRSTEVVADATNMLALESCVRRRAGGFPAEPLHYCAAHRHVRAQALSQPGFTAHFGVFCLSSAGRDTGHFQFEEENITRHIRLYLHILQEKLQQQELKITLKALDTEPGANPLFDRILEHAQAQFPGIEISISHLPQSNQQYYHTLQFGLLWQHGGRAFPIVDGGFTTWTQLLSGNRKERFLSSGIGLELLWKVLNGRV